METRDDSSNLPGSPSDYPSMDIVQARRGVLREDDEALVERACAGDTVAFGRLVELHGRAALVLARSLLGDPTEAEEAVQDAFCRVWRGLGGLRERAKFKVWLSGIVYRACRDTVRSRRRARRALERAEPSRPCRGIEPAAAAAVEEAMSLPEDYRDPLILFYLQELTVAELAEALGISEENAKVRLHRGRKMLRERLNRLGLGAGPVPPGRSSC
jgi:RNA polymerase sigma-70 factor (ECF subfamily)